MVSTLELIGVVGIIYMLTVSILSIRKFSAVRRQFLYKSILFFILAFLPMIILAVSSLIENFYILFVVTEFLFTLNLFYNYLKSNFTFLALSAIFLYMEDVMIIVAIYFSFYITGSIIQSMTSENKGSKLVLISFIAMDVSLVLQAFYLLRMVYLFMLAGVLLFFISVVIFMGPFLEGGSN